MKSLKKTIVSVSAAIALAFAIVVGGSTVSAQPAQAYSGSYDYYYCSFGYISYYKWHDYNWFEEYFQGKRDGYEFVGSEQSNWC